MENELTSEKKESSNVMIKYLKVVVLQNPLSNYIQFGWKVNQILDELDKT